MIKRDFHGWLLEDALEEVHKIVGDVRQQHSLQHAEFITGRGLIRQAILTLLEEYTLRPDLQWGNDGVVIVTIQ